MQTIKDILEIIYFLSGPALVVVAFFGLKQLKISTEQINETREARKINSKREAYKIAAEQCKYYMETIIPLLNKVDSIIEEKNLDYFKKSEIIIEGDSIKMILYNKDNALNKAFDECLEELHTVINYIEGFSVFFVSGVAADIVGYNTIGKTYVYSIKRLLPIIIPFGKDGAFNHTKKLFITWHNRRESETLLKQKAEVEEKISKQKNNVFEVIGTK